MAISPDGTRLLVSASTASKVHEIDTATGKIVGEFESGDQPHENNYSLDGSTIFHASIGTVYTPTDDPALDATKGDRVFQVVDARDASEVLKRIDMGQKLEEAGLPGHELRRPADGAVARRALRLLPGLVLPRLRRVRPAGQDQVLRLAEPADQRGGREASGARSTCSTPPTTAWR